MFWQDNQRLESGWDVDRAGFREPRRRHVDRLLKDFSDLNPVISQRAQMIRLMKTAVTITEKAKSAPVRRLAQNLVNQLCEMMPELEGVASWHEVGQRRTSAEYGRAIERTFSDDLLRPFSA